MSDQENNHQDPRPASLPHDVARCDGVGFAEDDGWDWREGCDVCLRRTAARPAQACMMEPPAIIAFECEYLILPNVKAHQSEGGNRHE